MTHKDIYTKFMIEYDKANVTSSYPSLTEYEVATVLDKAYNALIAQKITGNNIRKAPFEADLKSIEDITPLIMRNFVNLQKNPEIAENVYSGTLPKSMLYFIDGYLTQEVNSGNGPMDKIHKRNLPISLMNHHIAKNFFVTPYNMPWVKSPICYIEGEPDDKDDRMINVVVDPMSEFPIVENTYKFDGFVSGVSITPESFNGKPSGVYFDTIANRFVYLCSSGIIGAPGYYINFSEPFDNREIYDNPSKTVLYENDGKLYVYTSSGLKSVERVLPLQIVYIKRPNPFVKTLSDDPSSYESFFDWGTGEMPAIYRFECNDTVAEELISLAISFALENVESSRLTAKLNMRGLEG